MVKKVFYGLLVILLSLILIPVCLAVGILGIIFNKNKNLNNFIKNKKDELDKKHMKQRLEIMLWSENEKNKIDKEYIQKLIAKGMTELEAINFLNNKNLPAFKPEIPNERLSEALNHGK